MRNYIKEMKYGIMNKNKDLLETNENKRNRTKKTNKREKN